MYSFVSYLWLTSILILGFWTLFLKATLRALTRSNVLEDPPYDVRRWILQTHFRSPECLLGNDTTHGPRAIDFSTALIQME